MIVDEELLRRIEASAARHMADTIASFDAHTVDDPARGVPFGDGLLASFGPGRYVNRAIGVSMDDMGDDGLDELEAFFDSCGVPPSLEVTTWAPASLVDRLGRRGYVTEWFRNVFVSPLDSTAVLTHPTMMVREVTLDSLDEWLSVIRTGHDFDTPAAIVTSDEYARAAFDIPDATHYLADVEGEPAGCGSLRRERGIAWLGAATTLPRYRQRGVQGALVRERMAAGRASGCDLAVATAMPAGASARNLSRLGFTLACAQAVMTKLAR